MLCHSVKSLFAVFQLSRQVVVVGAVSVEAILLYTVHPPLLCYPPHLSGLVIIEMLSHCTSVCVRVGPY